MSADELRTAAATLRGLAEAATGEWHPTDDWYRAYEIESALRRAGTSTDAAADAAYIATMHPGVGQALADLLDVHAEASDAGQRFGLDVSKAPALPLARLINGGAP